VRYGLINRERIRWFDELVMKLMKKCDHIIIQRIRVTVTE